MLQQIFYLNEQGRRKNIEDTIYPLPGRATVNDRLFVVCDGVGGQSKGEEASRIACETIAAYFNEKNLAHVDKKHIEELGQKTTAALKLYALQYPGAENMSTTLTMVYLEAGGALAAWCGDSRICHIRDGRVLWQSQDHSLVAQLVAKGEITLEEAKEHPKRNIIFRSISAAQDEAKIETHFIGNIQGGDYILLCTDGLLEQINEQAIADILGPRQTENDKAKLVLQYCEDRTNDNFSMYLLHAGNPGKLFKKTPYIKWLAVFIGALAIAAVAFVLLNKPKKAVGVIKIQQPDTTEKQLTKKATTDTGAFNLIQQFNKSQKKK